MYFYFQKGQKGRVATIGIQGRHSGGKSFRIGGKKIQSKALNIHWGEEEKGAQLPLAGDLGN